MPRRLAGLAFALVWLAACGFEPLHGGADRTSERLAQVAIAPMTTRSGQLVRNRLLNYFEPPGDRTPAVYRLLVDVDEDKDGLAIEKDRTITRFNLRLQAHFRLVRISDGAVLLEGDARSIAAYNVIQSDYANLIAERDAVERGAQEIADAIGVRVAVRLRK